MPKVFLIVLAIAFIAAAFMIAAGRTETLQFVRRKKVILKRIVVIVAILVCD